MHAPIDTQLVFDAADPHALAAFWAPALHYEHEDIGAFVQGLLDAGQAPAELTTEVRGELRWKDVASIRHPGDGVGPTGMGTGRRILFQAVPEPKTVKNRVHLDLKVGPDRHVVDAEVDRLVALGARKVHEHDGPDGRWILMTDPEGNELDVT